MRTLPCVLAVLALSGSSAALAQTPIAVRVAGDTLTGVVELPHGLTADLRLAFEDAVGLTPTSLQITAQVIGPLDPLVAGRLPASVTLPDSFPVLLRIEPAGSSALSFSGVYTLSLHTHNLAFRLSPPLGLFKAAAGGPFQEITRSAGAGSYRVDGSSGGFSEFLIAVVSRPIDAVIGEKFDALDQALATHGALIAPATLSALGARLGHARTLYQAGMLTAAMESLEGFLSIVRAQSGITLPDVWRAHDDLVNIAGLLRAAAQTLRYSLQLKANGLP
jgi:hypothetical protein